MKWHYYNENDEKACAWIRELISARLVPDGEVDQRSICDVQPGDLAGFVQCHFFAGILGWSLALKLAGWPESRPVWTGSCPCQPFSDAGKGLGEADPRHLWPYFRNLIGNCRPAVVFGEQVGSKAGRLWLSRVRSDFQSAAYAFGAADLAAASLGAPHKRQRLFWVADSQFNERRANQPGRGPEGRAADGRDCSQPSGLADSELRRSEQRNTSERPVFEPHPGSANGRLEDSIIRGCAARQASESGCESGTSQPDDSGVVRLADTQSGGFRANGDAPRQTGHTQQREQAGRLGNSILPGLEGYAGNGADRSEPGRLTPGQAGPASETNTHAFWRDTRWIPTRDPRTGKTVMRRIPVEPSLQPLAARLPGRVGLLRGAGNAIVPQIAAQFIEAFLEVEKDHVAPFGQSQKRA